MSWDEMMIRKPILEPVFFYDIVVGTLMMSFSEIVRVEQPLSLGELVKSLACKRPFWNSFVKPTVMYTEIIPGD